MRPLLELIRHEEPGSAIAFRERIYRRGDQGELLRDVIALANAAAAGPRFLFLGVDAQPGRERRFPGVSERSWKSFCDVLPGYLTRTIEPGVCLTLQSVRVDGALVGALCLDSCEDPPYLLARRISTTMPAGGGWVRDGVKQRRLLRKHLQRIFEVRYKREDIGDVSVGFPGRIPREELDLAVMPLENATADDHYQYERRAHRLNLMLNNLSDKPHKDLVLTLKIPRMDGVGIADRVYPAPGERGPRPGTYPNVDVGPRTIAVQVTGLRIPGRTTIDAFFEPIRLCLRESARGQIIRVSYTLQGPTLERPVKGRLKIIATA